MPKFFQILGAPALQLRRLARRGGKPVLYIHGATFPSALSVGYRFADGRSWEDALFQAGFDVWALDFEGFGGSARPAAFAAPATDNGPQLRAVDAVQQIERAVTFIASQTRNAKPSLIAHSWGGVPAGKFAAEFPALINKLVLFAPPLMRSAPAVTATPPTLPAWRFLGVPDQLTRFVQDTPAGHASVLAEPALSTWGPAWLASDPTSTTRTPPTVQIPTGPQADIMALWSGRRLYNPATITAQTLIVRGEWDSVCNAADVARHIADMAPGIARLGTIPQSGHLAHLETNRAQLWAMTNDFLLGQLKP